MAFLEASPYNEDHVFENDDWESMDPMPGGDESFYSDGDLDDGLFESLAIIGLAGLFLFLIMYRRRRIAERQAENNGAAAANQQQPQGNQGLFPQPGDTELPGWAVGGVGH